MISPPVIRVFRVAPAGGLTSPLRVFQARERGARPVDLTDDRFIRLMRTPDLECITETDEKRRPIKINMFTKDRRQNEPAFRIQRDRAGAAQQHKLKGAPVWIKRVKGGDARLQIGNPVRPAAIEIGPLQRRDAEKPVENPQIKRAPKIGRRGDTALRVDFIGV